jgi:hypothetical protein
MRSISRFDDVIDTRDIIEIVEYHESEIESLIENEIEEIESKIEENRHIPNFDVSKLNDLIIRTIELQDYSITLNNDDEFLKANYSDFDEFITIKSFAEQCSDYSSDYSYGESVIRRSYFVDYCQDMVEDCGDIPKDIPNYICVDWQCTARNIEQDYSSVDFDGVEYLIRSC